MESPCARFELRILPLPSRLCLAAFLVCTGIGYFGALVQLHFQHASPGKLLPDAADAANIFHGRSGVSQLERILNGDEGKPFNGSGTMRQAFRPGPRAGKKRSVGGPRRRSATFCRRRWSFAVNATANDWPCWPGSGRAQSEGIRRKPFCLASRVVQTSDEQGRVGHHFRRHSGRQDREHFRSSLRPLPQRIGGRAGESDTLDTWEQIHAYCEVQTSSGGMAMKKLAQTSHVHLLGFAVLYGFTGLIFTFTSYPGWLRRIAWASSRSWPKRLK